MGGIPRDALSGLSKEDSMRLSCKRARHLVAVLTIGVGVLFFPRQSFAQG